MKRMLYTGILSASLFAATGLAGYGQQGNVYSLNVVGHIDSGIVVSSIRTVHEWSIGAPPCILDVAECEHLSYLNSAPTKPAKRSMVTWVLIGSHSVTIPSPVWVVGFGVAAILGLLGWLAFEAWSTLTDRTPQINLKHGTGS